MAKVGEETAICYQQGVEEGDEEVVADMLYIKPDGRAVRPTAPLVPANSDFLNGVASKDVDIDTENGLWGRIYLPESVAKKGPDVKVPVLVSFHGGGFCVMSPDNSFFTYFCEDAARVSEVVVISMSYRLAPEHRLPAAYEDAFTSTLWLQKQAELQAKGEGGEPWLTKHANFSKCFVIGESAGANIVHHLGVQLAKTDPNPLSIRGLILLVPFFGEEERTDSEQLDGAGDDLVPLSVFNRFWELALPIGANRDHPYSNVTELPLSKVLVVLGTKDPLYGRQIEYSNALRRAGRNHQLLEVPEGGHGFRFIPEFASEVRRVEQAIRAFIHEDNDSA
ncbi:hypothetical protein KC19_2G033100 [Ceratodon purpureus]|uniref:Alpha/beta hydrolase fold-3 domain-containing protein n=1 Tax=Ceratodon purpureus TaxID=3225 RepID=A0A8T0IPQ4_CERPU|nr:hypothetical protein KC19_2G033100 [Ceratodon purpureus]